MREKSILKNQKDHYSFLMELGKYRHYNGHLYEVIGVAHHSETLEELVVYRALYHHDVYGEHSLWVRPKTMFLEKISVEGNKILRFTKVHD